MMGCKINIHNGYDNNHTLNIFGSFYAVFSYFYIKWKLCSKMFMLFYKNVYINY